MPQLSKMSKSSGNVVTIDEVIYGVASASPSCEFRDTHGDVIDPREHGVWRDRAGDGMYYTSTRSGRRPVLLHHRGNPMPALLEIDGVEQLQHPGAVLVHVEEGPDGSRVVARVRLWDVILSRFPDDDE